MTDRTEPRTADAMEPKTEAGRKLLEWLVSLADQWRGSGAGEEEWPMYARYIRAIEDEASRLPDRVVEQLDRLTGGAS